MSNNVRILLIILLGGLLIRLWGVTFGLPFRYHVDEPQMIPPAAKLCTGDYNMELDQAGPNLQHVVLCIADIGLFLSGRVLGAWQSPSDFAIAYEENPTPVFLLARLLHVLLGVATVLLVYVIGKQFWSQGVGLVAAALLAFTYLHVRESHFASRDLFCSFLVTVSLLFASRLVKSHSLRDAAFSALFGGAAAGVMVTMGLSLLSTLVASQSVVSTERDNCDAVLWTRLKMLGVIGITAVAGFLLGYPNLILRPEVAAQYAEYLAERAQYGQYYGFAFSTLPGWLYILKTLWWGTGGVLFGVFAMGIIAAGFRHSMYDVIVLVFVVPYSLLLGGIENPLGRYLVPLIPFLCLLGGRFLYGLSQFVQGHLHWQGWVTGALVAIVVASSVVSSARFDHLLTQTDTRTLTKRWVEENVPEGARLAVDWPIHGPPLATKEKPEPRSMHMYSILEVSGIGLAQHSICDYYRWGYEYLITTSYISSISLFNSRREAERDDFYRELDENFPLLWKLGSGANGGDTTFTIDDIYGPSDHLWQRVRPGPTLKIYALPENSPYFLRSCLGSSSGVDMDHGNG